MKGMNVELTSWRKTSNSLSSSIIQKISDGYKVYNHYMNFNMINDSQRNWDNEFDLWSNDPNFH